MSKIKKLPGEGWSGPAEPVAGQRLFEQENDTTDRLGTFFGGTAAQRV